MTVAAHVLRMRRPRAHRVRQTATWALGAAGGVSLAVLSAAIAQTSQTAGAGPVRLARARSRLFFSDALRRRGEPQPGCSNPDDLRWAFAMPMQLPERPDASVATAVCDAERPVAAIVHDVEPRDQRQLVDADGALALMTLENHRLEEALEASARELRRSRDRVVAGADRERRRIERDLHDGAQQRLVALRINLELATDVADHDTLVERLHELAHDVEDTLDEIRALAHGVYPALLTDRGLAEALLGAVRRCPIPATLDPRGVGRYAPEVESAVYFCLLEALQNVAKHAGGAQHVSVVLHEQSGELEFSVRDDGPGMIIAHDAGRGLINMHDRVAAVRGELHVGPAPGGGTLVRGRVPALVPAPPAHAGKPDCAW
jgi:signal transduction histidine kinase